MKRGKIVNINVKVRLNRVPSKKEKIDLVKFVAESLDSGNISFYTRDFAESNETNLIVDHHYVTIRKMGRKW